MHKLSRIFPQADDTMSACENQEVPRLYLHQTTTSYAVDEGAHTYTIVKRFTLCRLSDSP